MSKKRTHYKLPAVETANGRIVWRPYIAKEKRTPDIRVDRKGRLAPAVFIGRDSDDPDAVLQAYLKAKATLEKGQAAKLHTLRWIMEEYMGSLQYQRLSVGSRKRNEFLLGILDHPMLINDEQKTLGDLHILDISKPLFHNIQDKRHQDRRARGLKGEVLTNREISLVSSALSWAVNYVHGLGIDSNPLLRFQKLPEKKNKRYVTDQEYQQQYAIAAENSSSYLPIFFELAYLCAARSAEVRNICLSDCTHEGIQIKRTKGSKHNLMLWSPRLRQAYDDAIARHKAHKILPIDPPLLINSSGDKITQSGLNTAMQRLKQEMKGLGLGHVYWNLHLLKSKGVSDAEDKRIAGHRSEAMRERYNTKMEAHKPAR